MKCKKIFNNSPFKSIYNNINEILLDRIFDDYNRLKRIPQHLDIINFGSNPAKFGLDYSEIDLKGYNMAVGPQTLEYDFRMLKNFHSYLDNNGERLLLLLFCPFSLCKYRYTEKDGVVHKDIRYYPILHHSLINNYSEKIYKKWKKNTVFQVLKSPGLIKKILRPSNKLFILSNPLNSEQMESSANAYLTGWMKEFELTSFDVNSIPEVLKDSLKKNSLILDDIIAFCKERNINPVFVLPPISSNIMDKIPNKFLNYCFKDIVMSKNLPILDYTFSEELKKPENFVDALCLNKTGRIKFTNNVISDLRNQNIIKR